MDPASIKAFKELEFLKSQLEGIKAANNNARNDNFTDIQPAKSREERLRELVMDLHRNTEATKADMSLGDLLAEANDGDSFTYTGGKQQKPDYKISAKDLAKKSAELQQTVRGYADSLEKINELETEVFRFKKSNKIKEQIEHPKTRMKVIWDDSDVTPLKLNTYRTR
jgi:uncharacterized protein YggL (DUF469 family)